MHRWTSGGFDMRHSGGRTFPGAPPVLAATNLGSDRALRQLAPIQDGLFEQLLKDNESSTRLEGHFSLDVPVTLLSDADVDALDRESLAHGWEGFHARHPGAQGLLILSRVTFDITGRVALVYAANGVENLHAAGYLVLLTNADNAWVVERSATLWVS
jgi:hypothetical protein